MSVSFGISRADGRSNAQVLIDYLKDKSPGRVFPYEELAQALRVGTFRAFHRPAVAGVVAQAAVRLLKEQQRTLINVRGVGYRLSHANDHRRVAMVRARRADVQMRRGVQTLQHVRWDELDPATRQLHEGMLLVVGGMYQQQQAMERRLRTVEDAVRALKEKAG